MAKKDRTDVAELSIGTLIGRLKPAQLWGTLAAICGALAGAAALGHQFGAAGADSRVLEATVKAEGEMAALKKEAETLRERQARSRGLEDKERFLSLYVRYFIAKEALSKSPDDPGLLEDASTTRLALSEFLEEGFRRGNDAAESAIDMRGLVIHKGGGPREATISFRFDGSVWPIPREFALVEKR